ncbi:hypothetical protein [Aquabacterium sp. OR-4]|uniref:hypothetical protein n=1 Tax=Aquabacterium sp. OR-4 TaxID=2978127 RepID=UPI0021B49F42|nr:hypothetical protein [Aquabacterium sp. OR-4]MDT7836365.1 hypothetical protein [Aquabacterium sp. OR-4]
MAGSPLLRIWMLSSTYFQNPQTNGLAAAMMDVMTTDELIRELVLKGCWPADAESTEGAGQRLAHPEAYGTLNLEWNTDAAVAAASPGTLLTTIRNVRAGKETEVLVRSRELTRVLLRTALVRRLCSSGDVVTRAMAERGVIKAPRRRSPVGGTTARRH